jgi:hypothetical protein
MRMVFLKPLRIIIGFWSKKWKSKVRSDTRFSCPERNMKMCSSTGAVDRLVSLCG